MDDGFDGGLAAGSSQLAPARSWPLSSISRVDPCAMGKLIDVNR